jgi:DNA gyrase/topoisomerase IV subunit B
MKKTIWPDHTADNIQVLTGAQAIRRRPNMYLVFKQSHDGNRLEDQLEKDPKKFKWSGGTKDPQTLTNLVVEAMCLSRAWAATGAVTEIDIKITNGTEVLITDNGPGITMEPKKVGLWSGKERDTGLTTIEIIASQLFGCQHLKHESVRDYCQMGIAVVNAVCSYFYITNAVDNLAHSIWYQKGEPERPPFVNSVADKNGIAFNFKFDPEVFGDLKIDANDLIAEIDKIRQKTPAKITLSFGN